MSNEREFIPTNLKKLRKHLGFNQTKMADKLGISQTHWANIETGKRNLTSENILILKEVFNISPNWLLLGKGEMFLDESSNITPDSNLDAYIEAKVHQVLEKKFLELFQKA